MGHSKMPSIIEFHRENGVIEELNTMSCFTTKHFSSDVVDIVQRAYKMAIKYGEEIDRVLNYMLSSVASLTQSSYGILCMKKYNEDTSIKLESISLYMSHEDLQYSKGSWRSNLAQIFGGNLTNSSRILFHNPNIENKIFGLGLLKSRIIIGKNCLFSKEDSPLFSFFTIPLLYKNNSIGTLTLGNGDYSSEVILSLYPLLSGITYFTNRFTKIELTTLVQRYSSEEKKDDFLSMVSHEIRTPLTGIVAMAQLIPEVGDLNDKQQEYVRQQNTCICQLMELLNDLNDFQSLKAHRLKLRFEPFDLVDCVEGSIDIVRTKAASKNLPILVKYRIRKMPKRVIGDGQRLRQVLINLLTNAIKFTESGQIRLRISARKIEIEKKDHIEKQGSNGETWKVRISVEDTGLGIPRSEQTKIFKVFKQGDAEKLRGNRRGLGLGLAISKSIIELMGGDIAVKSDGVSGKGSKFTLSLCFKGEVEVENTIKENIPILKGAEVLVVDDKKQNRVVLNTYLFKWHCSPITVETADEALQYLEKYEFRCAIIDMHMPLMTGIELGQIIREKIPTLPLIALSSIPNRREAGPLFNFYCYKPVVEHELLRCLLDCLKIDRKSSDHQPQVMAYSPEEQFTGISLKTKEELRILIAEDDENNAYIIKEILITLSFRSENISIVHNGKACVREVARNFYDVILMDIKMPILDGIQATEKIGKMERRPPIIAISAGTNNFNKEKCQAIGMAGYLTKPITKFDLEKVLSGFLK